VRGCSSLFLGRYLLPISLSRAERSQSTFRDGPSSFPRSFPILHQVEKHTSRRICQPSLDPPTSLLTQVPRDSRQRSSRPSRTDEGVEVPTVCLIPDLGTGREDMGFSICLVVELVRPDGVIQ